MELESDTTVEEESFRLRLLVVRIEGALLGELDGEELVLPLVDGLEEGMGRDVEVMLARDCEGVDGRTERLMDKAKDGVLPFEMVGVHKSVGVG